MGWLIALAVLAGLAVLPLGILAVYHDPGPQVFLLLWPASLQVYPAKKKEKKQKAKRPAQKGAPKTKQEKGGSLRDFSPLVDLLLDFLTQFRRKLRVDRLELKLILAGGDPSDLAQNYGRAWAAIGNLMPQLERFFVIKKRNIEAECDFTAEKTLIFARLELTITLGRLLALVAVHGFRLLREYLKIMKTRKGGAKL